MEHTVYYDKDGIAVRSTVVGNLGGHGCISESYWIDHDGTIRHTLYVDRPAHMSQFGIAVKESGLPEEVKRILGKPVENVKLLYPGLRTEQLN
ncbi:MAG: hypothetical protein H6502_04790 [Candidatus Woesearchaeota archaeon]|nr:MAG: hypothetical protein H6502_04790 [Candidatus Woesearchaeota archaeon]